jgi:hypothetical protein
MSIYIITPCSRVQYLEAISKTIPKECVWVIVYDSNCNNQILPYGDIILRPKNISGNYGKPHINYALDTLPLKESDWIYVLDDDNIIHPDWYENVQSLCDNNYNILSWGQLWNDNTMRLRPTEHMILRLIDQASYMWRYGFNPTTRFEESYFGDGIFVDKFNQKSHCIDKYISYYNYLSPESFTEEEKLDFDEGVLAVYLKNNIMNFDKNNLLTTQDVMNLSKIEQLDYSTINTTDVSHIKEIYLKSIKYRGGTACEVGSLGGHSTLSLCLAGLNVTSYDNDGHKGFKDKREAVCKDFNVNWIVQEGLYALTDDVKYDVVFHDSYHFEEVIPELVAFWFYKIKDEGMLIVHDVETFSHERFMFLIGNPRFERTKDIHGRELGTYYKN